MWFKTKQNRKCLTKCKERKNEVAGHRGSSPQDKAPGFQPQWHTWGTGLPLLYLQLCSQVFSWSLTCWQQFHKLHKKSFHWVLSTVPTHTDVQRCAKPGWVLTGRKLVWPPSDPQELCSQAHGHRLCVQRESESKILLITAKHLRPEETSCMEHPGPAPMGFGVQTLRAVNGGSSMSSVPNPASAPLTLTARLVQCKENFVLNLLHPPAL